MFVPVIGAAYIMTTKREAHWSEQTKTQNTEKGMYVGLKQPRRDGERYMTPAPAAAKETSILRESNYKRHSLALKVIAVAYERWSLTTGSKYNDSTWNL